MTGAPRIDRAREEDFPAICALLASQDLPLDGLQPHLDTTLVARDGDHIAGVAAVEVYPDGALLRSVAVDPTLRGRGIGRRLAEAALQLAEERGAPTAFLLTTTAENYFTKLGFEPVTRGDVPAGVQTSVEFTGACPASARVMRKPLAPPVTAAAPPGVKTVLFACVHNAGRSQMAAAWFNRLANPAKARALSAGTNPGPHVHPEVVTAMREAGVDLAGAPTTRLTRELAEGTQVLVTMGCGDDCPYVPGATRDDWPLQDPKGQPLEQVRRIRDDIRDRVRSLIERERWS